MKWTLIIGASEYKHLPKKNKLKPTRTQCSRFPKQFGKLSALWGGAEKPLVSISGGADSDIMLAIINEAGVKDKCTFAFYDTGLEWKATKNHLGYLENRYGIIIERFRPKKPIPMAVKEKGVPFISKMVSEYISRLQLHNFDFVGSYNKTIEELISIYPNCKYALKWYCDDYEKHVQYSIASTPYLKEFLRDNPPKMRISNLCCNETKKKTAHFAAKEFKSDLMCTGIRKAEGGIRANIPSCQYTTKGTQMFAPIFWFKNTEKEFARKLFDVKYSDCYEKYGFHRTGCAACPFATSEFENELEVMQQYEPNLYRAANVVFGDSYEYTRQFKLYRARMKQQHSKE